MVWIEEDGWTRHVLTWNCVCACICACDDWSAMKGSERVSGMLLPHVKGSCWPPRDSQSLLPWWWWPHRVRMAAWGQRKRASAKAAHAPTQPTPTSLYSLLTVPAFFFFFFLLFLPTAEMCLLVCNYKSPYALIPPSKEKYTYLVFFKDRTNFKSN